MTDIRIEATRDGKLDVREYTEDGSQPSPDRTGFYNMTLAYWLREEFPLWRESARIRAYPIESLTGLQLC